MKRLVILGRRTAGTIAGTRCETAAKNSGTSPSSSQAASMTISRATSSWRSAGRRRVMIRRPVRGPPSKGVKLVAGRSRISGGREGRVLTDQTTFPMNTSHRHGGLAPPGPNPWMDGLSGTPPVHSFLHLSMTPWHSRRSSPRGKEVDSSYT